MWGIPVLSGLTLQHSLVMNSLHTKLAHIINAFCWKAIVDCIPTPDLQGGARLRDTKPRHEAWPQCLQNCSATMVINLKGILKMLLFLVVQKGAAIFSFVSWSLRFYILTITAPSSEKGSSSSLTLWMCLLCRVIFFAHCFEHFNVLQVKITSSKNYSQLRCFCGMLLVSLCFHTYFCLILCVF